MDIPPRVHAADAAPSAAYAPATSAEPPIVRLRGLTKHYGKVEALRGLDMDIPRGPVGLLGPNGAGKTTLIGLLLGLIEPTSGEATIAGLSPSRGRAERIAIRKRVGYMPESDCLLPSMSGVELVSTLGRLTGLSREDAMTRAHEVLDYVELEEARYRPLDGYSTGMKQRLKLAQSLVHDPELLLLDEPTNGLDPKGRREMLALIDDLGRNQGKNILLCSHLLPDVERTCDHVVVIVRGKARLQGAIKDLTRAEVARVRVEATEDEAGLRAALDDAGLPWEEPPVAPESSLRRGTVVTLPAGVLDSDLILAAVAARGVAIRAIEPMRSTLEQVFLRAVDGTDQPLAPAAIRAAEPFLP